VGTGDPGRAKFCGHRCAPLARFDLPLRKKAAGAIANYGKRRKNNMRIVTEEHEVLDHLETGDDDLWVFGYGSLIWKPGFDYVDSALAWVHGYHRSLCIFSHVHRGTPERPGLVLGLDRGGSCQGVAFRVSAQDRAATIAYLRERELVTSVYLEKTVRLRFADGGGVSALAYVVDRRHHQYAGRLPLDDMTRLVADGVGMNGDNPAYVRNTYEHLLRLDIHDAELAAVVRRLDTVSCRVSSGFGES